MSGRETGDEHERITGLIDRLPTALAPPHTLRRQVAGYVCSAARLPFRAAVTSIPRRGGGRAQPHAPSTGEAPGTAEVRATPTSTPTISVIMPVYNAMRGDRTYLPEALESLAAQTCPPQELIIVDDGSSDDSAEVIQRFAAGHPELTTVLLRQDNAGQSSARNLGALKAGGDWLGFLDQDDLWTPRHIETVAPFLRDDVDFVYTDADTINEAGETDWSRIHASHHLGGVHPKRTPEDAIYDNVFVMPGVSTIRRSLFVWLGGFDERLSGFEDDDLFVRLLPKARIAYVPEATLRWRWRHGANYSRSMRHVSSRMRYWQTLMRDYAAAGRDRGRSRALTLRFFRDCLDHCSSLPDGGDPVTLANLAAAETMLPFVGPVDRAAFALARWAFVRRGPLARATRWWFLNGLERPTGPR